MGTEQTLTFARFRMNLSKCFWCNGDIGPIPGGDGCREIDSPCGPACWPLTRTRDGLRAAWRLGGGRVWGPGGRAGDTANLQPRAARGQGKP